MADAPALAVRRLMVRTGRGPLRRVWSAGYVLLARGIALYLRRGTGAAVFVRGSGLSPDHVHGLSDVDLVCVHGGADRSGRLIAARLRRLHRSGVLRAQVDVSVYADGELAAARGATALTRGGAQWADPAAPPDEAGLLLRPEGGRGWRLLAGTAPRSAAVTLPLDQERLAAWLELQSWWRHAFALCARPDRPDAALLVLKLYAEPTRVLLRTERGAAATGREAVLREALRELPEEETALRRACALARHLPVSADEEIEPALDYLLRTTRAVARALAGGAAAHGDQEVALVGARVGAPQPLGDWRALTGPDPTDDAFLLESGDAARPAALLAAARREADGVYRVLAGGGVAVLPTLRPWPRAVMRGVHFAPSAPVLFAQLGGAAVARFPEVPGWSARDTAGRAVAEHRAWLARQPVGGVRSLVALGLVLKAARAALFRASLEEGTARLALTPAATAETAGQADATIAGPLEDAAEAFERCRRTGEDPPMETIVRADAAVRSMRAYAAVPQAERLWPALP